MLDFPNNPSEGDIHVEKGQSWTFNQGAWVVGQGEGTSQVIAEDGANYQVVGDILIQWGVNDTVSGLAPVAFPIAFADIPTVTVTPEQGTGDATASVSNIAADRCDVFTRNTGGGAIDVNFQWMAVGEAPDALKKPKTIATGGAGAGTGTSFHDPNGESSWRIIGDTLECWGTAPAGGSWRTLVFPKTFARPPALTIGGHSANPTSNVRIGVVQSGSVTTTGANITTIDRATNNHSAYPIGWHAIGEWDGVS